MFNTLLFMLLPVILAALAAFLFGWLWYSPLMFQKPWMRLAGISKEAPNGLAMTATMLGGFLSYILLAFVMNTLFELLVVTTLPEALMFALLLWLGFVATLALGSVTWEGKPVTLYFLNNGYHLISFLLIATVLVSI